MSHVIALQFYVTDLAALRLACEGLGLELMEGQTTFKCYSRFMGDYSGADAAYRRGVNEEEYGKCLHAIRVKGGNADTYEIGLVARRDGKPGYELLLDYWQGGFGLLEKVSRVGKGGKDCDRLKEAYAIEVAKKKGQALLKQGWMMQAEKDAQGRTNLVYRRMG